ncbi:mucoidy inhibitor MuiA family protein [Tunicatimonas pelagia]|uniref:mucoidy inhibitor MuiA family protein n=1 Tax=Tunicatimonas pelagia TaxID=931531 RepID=UPI0026667121|nr:mucoidy inhibitor MuiA family protein [Tunicatimonas pelagia]WKN42954.1 mucoidy inhibitor MuiA family protein [Tunicatimonas pelagia]
MRRLLLGLLIGGYQTIAQEIPTTELNTLVKEVTVFLQGAHISRAGATELQAGTSTVTVKSLSPYLDSKSIQVRAKGDFTILSVNHAFNFLDKQQRNREGDRLQQLIDSAEVKIAQYQARLAILSEKKSLLHENKYLGSDESGVSLTQLKQAIIFFDEALSAIKSEELNIRQTVEKLEEQKTTIEQQIADISRQADFPDSEVQIKVAAKQPTQAAFVITYLVENAGWYPTYDVRVESVDQPLLLDYKADVYQRTGVDWNDVKLYFSNATPNQSSTVPTLTTWRLNYTRNTVYRRPNLYGKPGQTISGTVFSSDDKQPLPGVNVLVKESTFGTVTDLRGDYSLTLPNGASTLVFSSIGYATREIGVNKAEIDVIMQPDIAALTEVVTVGYGASQDLQGQVAGVQIRGVSRKAEAEPVITTTVENQTTVAFEVATPYSIRSDGEKQSITLKQYDIEAKYEYFAVPKLDKDAFLVAHVVGWDQYHLLEGEANLYFEDTYVGRSVLDARALKDTISISLGRDRNIVVGRTQVEDYTQRRILGANKIESQAFEILVRNKKSQSIELTVRDQLPLAVISTISVEPTQLSGGILNEKSGQVTWRLSLPPQTQQKRTFGYEVKYPKKETVPLDY